MVTSKIQASFSSQCLTGQLRGVPTMWNTLNCPVIIWYEQGSFRQAPGRLEVQHLYLAKRGTENGVLFQWSTYNEML